MAQSLTKSTTIRRKSLFILFTVCVLLIIVFTSVLMTTGYGSALKHLPKVQGIYEKMPFFNSSVLKYYVQKSACPTCKPTVCPTITPKCDGVPTKNKKDCPTPKPCPLRFTDFSYFKRELNRQLAEIYVDLKHSLYAGHKDAVTPQTLLKLEAIMEQLDKSYRGRELLKVEQPVYLNSENETLDVCPEEYRGEKKGYPFFQTGWVTTNCTNVKPLPSVVAIVMNTMEYPIRDEDKVNLVLRGIHHTYPGVQVYLAPKNNKIREMAQQYPNVTAINVKNGSRMGKVWNQLMSMVKTPYTLVGRDLVHFTWTARIRRQIRMISEIDYVGVVGGSFRNWTGHWRIGCRQSRKKNYVLEYQEGYHHSARSCMFCDDLEGPFVAKTHILKTAEFGEKLPSEVVFEDFFLKVFDMGYLTMNCPDAMYFANDYTTQIKRRDRKVWQFFSSKWKFVRILLPGRIMHSFSCQDISYRCTTSVTKYATMPECCLEQYGKAMKFFEDLCREHNFLFELDAGSVLGAVKMSGLIPWDLDGDISLLSNNFSILYSFQDYIRQKGYNLNAYSKPKWDVNGTIIKNRKGYLVFHSPDIYTEINGWPTLSGFLFLPPELRDPVYFTKSLVNGYWISSTFSPGLFARNRYGLDVLKHSQSWLQVGGMGSSWSRYKPGRFLGCKHPKFHACLDKLPVDGNIAFQVPSREQSKP